jgi:hypothetical protein
MRIVCLALLLLAAGCSKKPETPEERVRAMVKQAEGAAAEGDVSALRELVSDRFRGPGGQDKRALNGVLNYHFLRYGKVHTLTRIAELNVLGPGRAEVGLVVALAASPIENVGAIPDLHADLYRFDWQLSEEDGEWRVTGADWRRAGPQEMLGGE